MPIDTLTPTELRELAVTHRATIRWLERRLAELEPRPILAEHCHGLRGELLLARAMLADAERTLAGGLPVPQIRAVEARKTAAAA